MVGAILAEVNVSLTKESEQLVARQLAVGRYNNASEVVADALRRAFSPQREIDLEQDTPELAALLLEGMNSRHKTYKDGDAHKILAKVRRSLKR